MKRKSYASMEEGLRTKQWDLSGRPVIIQKSVAQAHIPLNNTTMMSSLSTISNHALPIY